jgi:toxin ParE1/3/4
MPEADRPEYSLTTAAEQDLLHITLYGLQQFGSQQARVYHLRLVKRFEELVTTPELYQPVEHIRKGYRRSVCGAHSIYYRVHENTVEIVRILGAQELVQPKGVGSN